MPEHYPDELSPSSYRARALDRSRVAKHRVGAAVEKLETMPDGTRHWHVIVTDGTRYHHIEVRLPEAGPHEGVPPSLIESALEEEAGRFPEGARLNGLLSESPLDLHPALPG
jgi:hypothetical protein